MNWPLRDIERLKAEWNAGNSASTVAAKLGRTRNAVIGMVNRLRARGVSLRTGDPTKPGKVFPQPKPKPNYAGCDWWKSATTEARIAQIRAAAEAGFTAGMVATIFKLTRSNVLQTASHHGIRFKPDNDMRKPHYPRNRPPAPKSIKAAPRRIVIPETRREPTIDDYGDDAWRIFNRPSRAEFSELRF